MNYSILNRKDKINKFKFILLLFEFKIVITYSFGLLKKLFEFKK